MLLVGVGLPRLRLAFGWLSEGLRWWLLSIWILREGVGVRAMFISGALHGVEASSLSQGSSAQAAFRCTVLCLLDGTDGCGFLHCLV